MPQKLSHQGKEKLMGMSKEFAPSKPAEKSSLAQQAKTNLYRRFTNGLFKLF
jgi:hypothetical protein